MPPTFAAAKKTYSGFSFSKNWATSTELVRSNSLWVRTTMLLYPFALRFLTRALPTNPRCPATYIFASGLILLEVVENAIASFLEVLFLLHELDIALHHVLYQGL